MKPKGRRKPSKVDKTTDVKLDTDIARARARGIRIHWHGKFLRSLLGDWRVQQACAVCNIARQTSYDHRDIFPEFKAKWDEIVEGWMDKAEAAMFTRAVDGVESQRYDDEGNVISTEMKYSDRLLEFMLKGRRKHIYGDSHKVEHSGTVITQTPEETVAAAIELERSLISTLKAAAGLGRKVAA